MFHKNTLIDETSLLSPNFSPNRAHPLTEEQQRYASFYGINFSTSMPGVKHEIGHFESNEYRLFAQSWENKESLCQGTLLILHGYFDHIGLYQHIIDYGLSRNLRVVGFDLPGHGISSGDEAAIPDFLVYQDILKEWLDLHREQSPKPWYLIAQSTGAAIAMDYLLINQCDETNNPFRKVAFLAPLVRPTQLYKIKMLYHALKPFKKYINRTFTAGSNNPKFNCFIKQGDPLQSKRVSREWVGALLNYIHRVESAAPVPITPLIFQGDQDTTVSYLHNLAIIEKKFWQPKVIYLDGAKHHLANETENFRRIIFNELDQWFDLKKQTT